jgi:hypothetical protein
MLGNFTLKMDYIKKGIFIGILLAFTSCKQILFSIYGIHKPRIITTKTIENKIERYGLIGDYNLSISEIGFIEFAKNKMSVNKLFIYTSDGKLISPNDTNSCSSTTGEFVEYFKDSTLVNLVDTSSLNYYNHYFVNFDGSPTTIANNKPYYAVVFWASYVGRLNKNLSAKWVQVLSKDPSVTLICVSIDPREFWGSFDTWNL